MKSILLIIFIGTISSSGQLFAQESQKFEYVYICIRESTTVNDSKITVVYPDGTVETIAVGTIRVTEAENNAKTINKLFNKLGSDGFELVSSTGGEYYSRYVFKK